MRQHGDIAHAGRPSAIATVIETNAIPRSICGNFPFLPSAAPSAWRQAALIG
jgi:hypothetical protein